MSLVPASFLSLISLPHGLGSSPVRNVYLSPLFFISFPYHLSVAEGGSEGERYERWKMPVCFTRYTSYLVTPYGPSSAAARRMERVRREKHTGPSSPRLCLGHLLTTFTSSLITYASQTGALRALRDRSRQRREVSGSEGALPHLVCDSERRVLHGSRSEKGCGKWD